MLSPFGHLELVELQFVCVLAHAEDVLQVNRGLDVLHAQLLQPRKLETQGKFIYVHDQQDILNVAWGRIGEKGSGFV